MVRGERKGGRRRGREEEEGGREWGGIGTGRKGKGEGDRVLVVKANSRAASGHTSAPVALLLWHCYRDRTTHEAVDTKDASAPLTLVGTENPPPPNRYYGASSVWLALMLHFN